jgi:hypothetical protein
MARPSEREPAAGRRKRLRALNTGSPTALPDGSVTAAVAEIPRGERLSAVLLPAVGTWSRAMQSGLLAWRLALGADPAAIRPITTGGPSYLAVSALIAVAAFGTTRRQRALALSGWLVLTPFMFQGITTFNTAAVGHVGSTLVAVVVGALFCHNRPVPMPASTAFARRQRGSAAAHRPRHRACADSRVAHRSPDPGDRF